MAVLALHTLGAEMWVIFLVTGIASRPRCHIEDRFYMAGLALERFMRALNFMIGIDIVIKRDTIPVGGDVAGLTSVAKVPVVVVIFEMT